MLVVNAAQRLAIAHDGEHKSYSGGARAGAQTSEQALRFIPRLSAQEIDRMMRESTRGAVELYMELCERGYPSQTLYDAPDHRPAAKAVADLAQRHGELKFQGAWRMEARYCQELEQSTGYVPPGGWHGLASILVGCGVLDVSAEGFIMKQSPAQLGAMSASALQRQMIEALSQRLIPPTTAAGLFLLMGLHPAWGLRLAFETQPDPDPKTALLMRDRHTFPPHHLPTLSEAVFTTIAAILSLLKSLHHDRRYPIDGLSSLIFSACALGQEIIYRGVRHPTEGRVPIMITHLLHVGEPRRRLQRAQDFTVMDLMDAFLVPAGVVRRFDDHTFSVNRLALTDDVRLGHGEQTLKDYGALTKLLAEDPAMMVA